MDRIRDISGAILAGGASKRIGREKALLPFRGKKLVAHVHERVAAVFEEVVLVTNAPGLFPFLPCRMIRDRVPGKGPLSGVDAALRGARTAFVFISGCDMPFLSEDLLRLLAGRAQDCDLVLPYGPAGPEPLCAVYGKGALPRIEEALTSGALDLAGLAQAVRTRVVPPGEVAAVDPGFRSFRNVNTPEDYLKWGKDLP
jgi:molybdopterin-guanine dinucleotide biosynthesis protein A